MSFSNAESPLPAIVAHRGASSDAPENTLESFKLAWKQGADAIEGDFQMTSDGRIVCFHDPEVMLTDGQSRRISETSFIDLRKFKAVINSGKSKCEVRIPTIDEVFKTVPENKGILVEVKCGPEIVPPLLDEIKSAGFKKDQVIIISFYPEVIHQLKELSPDTRGNWLVKFKRDRIRLSPNATTIIKMLQALQADGVGVQATRRLNRRFVSAITDAGFGFHVWTVDSPGLARNFVQIGVDSITTNKPETIRTYLNKTL